MLQEKQVDEITVTEICKKANCNRSTFYSSYLDIYDLVEKIRDKMMDDFKNLYLEEEQNHHNSNNYLKLFQHIKENSLFYQTYFRLGFDMEFKIITYDTELALKYYNGKDIEYHMHFFKAGITMMIKLWLQNNCDLTPEHMNQILMDEYKNKHEKSPM